MTIYIIFSHFPWWIVSRSILFFFSNQEINPHIIVKKVVFYITIFIFQWNSICLELSHCALKLVCAGMVQELKRQKRHIPALSIASAINERLNCLLPTFATEGVPADRALMFSEAARRDTFIKWPHMNYKCVYFACLHQYFSFFLLIGNYHKILYYLKTVFPVMRCWSCLPKNF